jgi:hypothetical protein
MMPARDLSPGDGSSTSSELSSVIARVDIGRRVPFRTSP